MARRTFGNLRKLPSGRWQGSYIDDGSGKRISAPSTFPTKADAVLWPSTVEADRARGHLLGQQLAVRPFDEWASDWLAGLHAKPNTEVSYESSLRNHVLPAFQKRPVGAITYRDCKPFVDGMKAKGLAPGASARPARSSDS